MSDFINPTDGISGSPETNDTFIIPGIYSKIKAEFEANNFYQAICSNGENIIKVLTKEGIFQFVSENIDQLTGYSVEELMGRNILSYIQPLNSKYDKKWVLMFDDPSRYRKIKLVVQHRQGYKVYFESYCYFKLDIEGHQLYVLICKDITKAILKEKQLIKSKIREEKTSSLLRKLNDISPNLIILWDVRQNKPIYHNRNFPGYNTNKVSEVLFSLDIVHVEDREKVSSYRNRILTFPNFDPPPIEYRVYKNDGEIEWLMNRSIIVERDESGLASLILSVNTFTTELRNIQEKLYQNLTRTAAMLEFSKERIYLIDQEFRLITFNSTFVEQYLIFCGQYPEMGESIFKHSTKEDEEKWKPLYEKGFNGESFTYIMVYDITPEKYYFDCTFTPVLVENGLVKELACFVRDITSIKRSESELQKLNFELDSFVYRASHDMMAPLKSILGLVNILRMDLHKEEKEKYLTLVDKSVLKLENFIKDLTIFSKNSKTIGVVEEINFSEILDETMESMAFMEDAKRLKVRKNIDQDIKLRSVKTTLLIVFQNFISNSIKYQRREIESTLLIEISKHEQGAVITLTDNGRGIKSEYLDRIFEMFYRASEESFGSGLGLYITKQAIEKLGGRIVKVESEFGKGTSISFYVPSLN